jgi:hypothetical protein
MAKFDHQSEHTNPAAFDLAKHLQENINRAKISLEAAQQKQQAYYNQNRPTLTFEPNQLVLLSTKKMPKNRGRKLLPKWMGPFVVQRTIGPVAVKLRLPETMRCHNVFHDSW